MFAKSAGERSEEKLAGLTLDLASVGLAMAHSLSDSLAESSLDPRPLRRAIAVHSEKAVAGLDALTALPAGRERECQQVRDALRALANDVAP